MSEDTSLGPTEQRNDRSAQIDRMETREILLLMNDQDATVPAAVRRAIPEIERAVDEIVARWRRGAPLLLRGGDERAPGGPRRLRVPAHLLLASRAGAGHHRRGDVALRRAVEGAEDDARAGALAVQRAGAGERDVVVGLAASGSTPYVLGALGAARGAGGIRRGRGLQSEVCPERRGGPGHRGGGGAGGGHRLHPAQGRDGPSSS